MTEGLTSPAVELAPLSVPRLNGSLVRLELLSLEHVPALVEAGSEDASLYAWTVVPKTPSAMQQYVESALLGWQRGQMLPFAIIRLADGKVVGSTRYYSSERWAWPPDHPAHGRVTPDVCEIGYTWLARSAVRSGVNTQAKRLLLRHAFETWQVHRVSFRTDVRNVASRKAIERIGGKLDGRLRCERPGADGAVRDTVVYSIVAEEWPTVSEALRRLESREPSGTRQ
jgi:RimJ/RimL family protein N-acetyltransferase